jgi:alginate production protein
MVGLPSTAAADKPEYLLLKLEPGTTIEVKGEMNDAGHLVVSDIELLTEPRRPKLRGKVESVDHANGTIVLFGMTIHATIETEYVKEGGGDFSFDQVIEGEFLEVSCKVKNGQWLARKITGGDLKKSNKIKATVTSVGIDGVAPDSLEVSGLIILLNDRTDVNSEAAEGGITNEQLFGDMGRRRAVGMRRGIPFGDGRIFLGAEYRHNLRTETNFDLTPQFQSDRDDTQPELRLRAGVFFNPYLRAFVQVRARKRYIIASDQELSSETTEAVFTQLYVLMTNARQPGLALQIGRQDFDEPREWLFDEYLDAVRALYFTPRFTAEAAVIHSPTDAIKQKFDTWTDAFVMARWFANEHNQFGAYVLRRWDSDSRKREPIYYGARYFGRFGRFARPWIDMALMRGEDKGKTLDAWAFDIGGTVFIPSSPLRASFTLAYAVGSGDETGADDVSTQFRQTGYQDNYARFGGVTSIRYYGALLDPELSNLTVLTAGVGVRPTPGSSIDVVYHRYNQYWADDEIQGSDLVDPPARPNGFSSDVGWGVDVVAATPWFFRHVTITGTFAYFKPGEAFAPRQESALLNKIDLIVRF